VRAAQCALALHALLPESPMALATGWSEAGHKLPGGDAIDRATKLLDQPGPFYAHPPDPQTPGPAGEAAAIVIDEVTAALLDQRFEVTASAGKLHLRGLRELDIGARTLLGKATTLMGRDWELSSIQSLFQDCIDEQAAHALLITGPAGMGKSRLAYEAVRMLERGRADLAVWKGRADPLRAGSALGLLGGALQSATGIHESEPLEDRRRRITERVRQHVPAPAADRVAAFLGEIISAPFDDATSAELRAARKDLRLMSHQMQQAWLDFLAAECAAHPVLLVLEDLHWGDVPTARLVDEALRRLPRGPWMVLALARPEVHASFPRLWADRHLQEIRLSPLPRRASERLVREVLGNTVSAEKTARIAEQADGNAFYLEELIRAVAERRRGDEDSQPLPQTVLAMVQARLDGLDADARRVLRAASVFGEVFWPGGVSALLGGGTGPLPTGGWASDLIARELVVQRAASRFDGEPELSFRHALLREGAYAMLTADDRALGHRLAGAWLIERGERDPLVLASHFELGGEPARAGGFYLRASIQALRGADTDAAIALAEQALAAGIDDEHRIACLDALCQGYMYRNDHARCAECAAEVKRLAAPGSAEWIHATALGGKSMLDLGRYPEFFESVMILKSVEPTQGTVVEVAQGLFSGAICLCIAAQYPLAVSIIDRLDEVVAPFAAGEPMVRGFAQWAHAYEESWMTGDAWAALGHMEAAIASFEEAHDRGPGQFAEAELARFRSELGMYEEAEHGLRAVNVEGDRNLVAILRSRYLARALVEREAFDEAGALARELITIGRARRYPDDLLAEADGHWTLGRIAVCRGDFAAAAHAFGEALEQLRTLALYWPVATALLASAELARGRTTEALALMREVVAVTQAQSAFGMRGGLVRLVHAEALYASGDRAAASRAIAAARDVLSARAAKIPEPAARRIFLERVRENARTLALAQEWLRGG
jgi:tetratricopeptide (TPR) repeat protein